MGHSDNTSLDALRIDRSQDRRGSRWPWFLGVLLLVASGLLVFRYQDKPLVVSTATVIERVAGEGSFDTATSSSSRTVLNASGYVNARRQATVSAKTTGKIVEVLIEEGMKVDEGDVLARLDTSNLGTSLGLAEAQLVAARSAIQETEVRLQQAEREFDRVKQLIAEQIASESDFDNAEAEVKSLRARLIRQQAEVAVAQQQIAFYQQQLDDLTIRAPFTGVVVSKDAQPGEMISPVSAGGGFTRTGICTLVDMDSLEIEVDVNEAYINRVRAGQPVSAVLDAYPDWKIPARVIAIIPTADRQKATVKVRIGLEETDERILPDMGVKVAFQTAQRASADSESISERRWMIPASALDSTSDGDRVWVLEDGKVEPRRITVQAREGESLVVASGLVAGEQVVVGDTATLQSGQRVATND